MSRIAKRPLKIEEGINASYEEGVLNLKSVKGQINISIPSIISLEQSNNIIWLKRGGNDPKSKSLHGLSYRLVNNAIYDLSQGVKKEMVFKGTGYRAKVENNNLIMSMGYSHPIELIIPDGISVTAVKNSIILDGYDRQQVGQFAAIIRNVRPPEPYKGKGIIFKGEIIKKKAGKAAQTVGKPV